MKLWLNDGDWQVITASWTAASKNNHSTEIAYVWGLNEVSVFSGATGISCKTLDVPFDKFAIALRNARDENFPILDCRRWCK